MISHSIKIIEDLRYDNGLIAAARQDVDTGYHCAWIRDNIYSALAFEVTGQKDNVEAVYHRLLDILHKQEYKIDWMIRQPHPKHHYRYIHPRYDPQTCDEIHGEWGNKQNDATGLLLFKIGSLQKKGYEILRDKEDLMLVQKLVDYLQALEYWHDTDNGIWENEEEVHASSIGACLAGLQAVKEFVEVPEELIEKGRKALDDLLPRESESRETDLALLSLIYPFEVVDEGTARKIISDVEDMLLRDRGVIRHHGDWYYQTEDQREAEWCMGLPWLAIAHKKLGNLDRHKEYLKWTFDAMNDNGEIPELYLGGTDQYNENTPLGWAQSLFVVANF